GEGGGGGGGAAPGVGGGGWGWAWGAGAGEARLGGGSGGGSFTASCRGASVRGAKVGVAVRSSRGGWASIQRDTSAQFLGSQAGQVTAPVQSDQPPPARRARRAPRLRILPPTPASGGPMRSPGRSP